MAKAKKSRRPKARRRPAMQTKRPPPPPPQLVDIDVENPSPPLPRFSIAGVGASAGGLEAFGQLLQALPSDPGIAIVFVQHLAPKHDSMLPELLAGTSNIPVIEVRDQ